MFDNILDVIINATNKVMEWVDNIISGFLAGENKFLVWAIMLYIVGLFSKFKFNVNLGKK